MSLERLLNVMPPIGDLLGAVGRIGQSDEPCFEREFPLIDEIGALPAAALGRAEPDDRSIHQESLARGGVGIRGARPLSGGIRSERPPADENAQNNERSTQEKARATKSARPLHHLSVTRRWDGGASSESVVSGGTAGREESLRAE